MTKSEKKEAWRLERVSMRLSSVLSLIERIRSMPDGGSWYTTNEYCSSFVKEGVLYASDKDVLEFLSKLDEGVEKAELEIAWYEWEEGGNCTGDYIHPSQISATRLADGRYYIEASFHDGKEFAEEEYILFFEEYIPFSE